jgi:Zn-finger nucleic acid-binding protein
MNCPRDATEMTAEQEYAMEVHRCSTCKGVWLNHDELDKLEATVASTEEERRATVMYAEIPSELKCPVCDKQMIAFDYRAHAVQLDTCEEHGWWLDAGEEQRVREVIAERVRDLHHAADAEAGWRDFLGGLQRKKR